MAAALIVSDGAWRALRVASHVVRGRQIQNSAIQYRGSRSVSSSQTGCIKDELAYVHTWAFSLKVSLVSSDAQAM